jgi:5-hydroxyisourate hydrolase-like protein (transthyretin family)
MFAGLGKNGQIVSVSPSQGLVVVRMGNQPGSPAADIAPQLCNQIWDRLQLATGATTDVHPGGFVSERVEGKMLANGTGFELNFAGMCDRVVVFDMKAQPQIVMLSQQSGCKIDISGLAKGVYVVRLKFGDHFKTLRFVK